jgi:type VI secretion system protein ImpE
MEAEEHVRAGRLKEALAELQARVRKQPADPKLRVFLFQLLAVLGQWDRALTQLQVAGEIDPSALAMVQTYREALRCEILRREVFAGHRSPLVFGEPAEWMALLVQALKLAADDKVEEAQALRERAFEAAPTTPGRIDDQPFEWLADADPRLGPMLEAIVNGRYYWIPFHRLTEIQLEKPSDLRDMVWTAANLTLENGGQSVALIPTRYPGSEDAPDARLAMARATEWRERPFGLFEGIGQRVLATDQGEHALMDTRVVSLGQAPAATAEAEGG